MTHGDDNGLALPPAIAPIQVVVIPVAQHKEGVIEKAQEVKERLAKLFRTDIDISDNSPGWKFAQYEMKGVPRVWKSVQKISNRTSASLSAATTVKKPLFLWTSWKAR